MGPTHPSAPHTQRNECPGDATDWEGGGTSAGREELLSQDAEEPQSQCSPVYAGKEQPGKRLPQYTWPRYARSHTRCRPQLGSWSREGCVLQHPLLEPRGLMLRHQHGCEAPPASSPLLCHLPNGNLPAGKVHPVLHSFSRTQRCSPPTERRGRRRGGRSRITGRRGPRRPQGERGREGGVCHCHTTRHSLPQHCWFFAI